MGVYGANGTKVAKKEQGEKSSKTWNSHQQPESLSQSANSRLATRQSSQWIEAKANSSPTAQPIALADKQHPPPGRRHSYPPLQHPPPLSEPPRQGSGSEVKHREL